MAKKKANFSLDVEILEQLNQHAKLENRKKSTIVELALQQYFDKKR